MSERWDLRSAHLFSKDVFIINMVSLTPLSTSSCPPCPECECYCMRRSLVLEIEVDSRVLTWGPALSALSHTFVVTPRCTGQQKQASWRVLSFRCTRLQPLSPWRKDLWFVRTHKMIINVCFYANTFRNRVKIASFALKPPQNTSLSLCS